MKKKTTSSTRKGVGYVRVSRVNGRGGEAFISPDVQRERIAAAAAAHGIEIVKWYEDLDQSGKKYERPGFQAALRDIEENGVSVIVVARMSRFARSVLDAHRAIERLEKSGGQLIAGDLNVDTTTPQGKLMRDILAAIAAFEVEVATESWRDARLNASARGIYMRKAPVGYMRNEERQLVPDPATRNLVVEAFKKRAAGASWFELLHWWKAQGGPKISRQGLTTMLRNRTYLGEVEIPGEDEMMPDAHEALVTVEQYEAAQAAAGLRPARNGNGGSLLAGILVCTSCGRPMTTGRATNGTATYRCQRQSRDGVCPSPMSVSQHVADPVVEEAFLAWANVEFEGIGTEKRDLEAAQQRVESAEAELVAFVSVSSASRNPELFAAAVEEREDAIAEAQAEVARLRATERVEGLRTSVPAEWPNLRVDERRKLIGATVERVEVHRGSTRMTPFAERSTIIWRHGAR